MEDKKAIKETLIIKGGGRPKITHFFCLQTRAYGKKRRRKEKKRKKERNQAKVWIHDFCMELYGF